MLTRLVELYSKNANSGKTPLEDFTTEAFAGVLENNTSVKTQFIQEFLELPIDNYSIKTQKKYTLDNDIDCIIDMVIEGDNNICFIENKVNSSEGYRQLERYCLVLDYFKQKGISTTLFYCTKYSDTKEINAHNFKQFRWHELSYFLNRQEDDVLTSEFVKFLTDQEMAKDTTLYSTDFIVFESIQEVLNKCNEFMDSARPNFEQKFCNTNKISDGKSTPQILKHNRLIYYVKDFIQGDGWSELGFGVSFEEPCIYVEVYLDKKNENHELVAKLAEESEKFLVEKYDYGTSFWLEQDLSVLLNQEDSDQTISTWFKNSFELLENFIETSELKIWNK